MEFLRLNNTVRFIYLGFYINWTKDAALRTESSLTSLGLSECLSSASWLHSFIQITLSAETEKRKEYFKVQRSAFPAGSMHTCEVDVKAPEEANRAPGLQGLCPQVLCEGNTEAAYIWSTLCFPQSGGFHAWDGQLFSSMSSCLGKEGGSQDLCCPALSCTYSVRGCEQRSQ